MTASSNHFLGCSFKVIYEVILVSNQLYDLNLFFTRKNRKLVSKKLFESI